MKRIKRFFVVFLMAIICTSSFFLSGCTSLEGLKEIFSDFLTETEEAENSFDDNINNTEDENLESDEQIPESSEEEATELEEEETESQESENSQPDDSSKVFVESISLPNEIYLTNNGVGISLFTDITPQNFTEEINIEIMRTGVIKRGRDLTTEERRQVSELNDDFLYPMAEGKTRVELWTTGKNGERISASTTIFVEESIDSLTYQIVDKDGQLVNSFISEQNSDGVYEIYTAKIYSKNLCLDDVDFTLSSSIILCDGIIKDGNYFIFSFYLTSAEEHTVEVSIVKNYLNIEERKRQISFESIDYVQQYSFVFSVKEANPNVEYLFEENQIIVSNFSECERICFEHEIFSFGEVLENTDVRITINGDCHVCCDIPLGGIIYIEVKDIGEFVITITEIYSGASEEIFVLVNE